MAISREGVQLPVAVLRPPPPSSVLIGRLIGKNGVRALHELCSKYCWDMPKYTPVEPPQQTLSKSANTDDGKNSNSVGNNDISFVLTVHVNGVELGCGCGSTKASAKQDASRKALSALVPGCLVRSKWNSPGYGWQQILTSCGLTC